MLKPFLLLSAVVLFVIAPTPRPTLAAASSPQEANATKSTPAAHERAKKLYAMDCAFCHGDNGNGKTDMATSLAVPIADWTDPKTLADKSDQDLFNDIRKGKGDKMPPEDAGRAKDDDVHALIVYIRSFSKGQPSVPSPAAPAAAPADAAPAAPAPGR